MKTAVTMIKEGGVFGKCSCGAEVIFYSNHGVQCKKCDKLYGVWHYIRKKNSNETLKNKTSTYIGGGTPIPLMIPQG